MSRRPGDPRTEVTPDASTRERNHGVDSSDARTEALTPERRKELMAAAERHLSGEEPRVRTASTSVRVNSSRHQVAPLDPDVNTESGVAAASPNGRRRGPVADHTVALPPEQLPRGFRTGGSGTQRLPPEERPGRTEAEFEAPHSDPAPGRLPTSSAAIAEQAAGFEADATVAYDPRAGLPPGFSTAPPSRSDPDVTADDVPVVSSSDPPSIPEPPPQQPSWLQSSRPVDLQRPPSGAPSEFGDVRTGQGPVPLADAAPEPGPFPPLAPDTARTAFLDMEAELGEPMAAAGRAPNPILMPAIALLLLTLGVSGGVWAAVWGPLRPTLDELLGKNAAAGDPMPPDEGEPAGPPTGATPDAPPDPPPTSPEGSGPGGALPPDAPPPTPGPDAIPVRVAFVDDVSSGVIKGLVPVLRTTTEDALRRTGRFAPQEGGAPVAYSLSLWIKGVRLERDEQKRTFAEVECSFTAKPMSDEGEPARGQARGTLRPEGPGTPDAELAQGAVARCSQELVAQLALALKPVTVEGEEPAQAAEPGDDDPDEGAEESGSKKGKKKGKKGKKKRGKKRRRG